MLLRLLQLLRLCFSSASLPLSLSLYTHSAAFPGGPSAATAAAPFWAACVLIILCVLRQNKAKLARFNIFNCLEIYSYQAGCSASLTHRPLPRFPLHICLSGRLSDICLFIYLSCRHNTSAACCAVAAAALATVTAKSSATSRQIKCIFN